jgi:membrane protease YdiL (CAAX protease family)
MLPTPSRRELATFLALAFAIPWLLWLLLQLTGVDIVAAGGMLAAGLATFVTMRWVRRSRDIRRQTALTPLRPLVRYCVIGLLVPLAFGCAAIGIGALAGVYPLDLAGLSMLRRVFAPGSASAGPGLILTALGINLALLVILLPLAFCEEWAWRGYLLPALRPLGVWPALLLSSLIWGLWHLPGYVGPYAKPGLVPFLITVLFYGVLLGWLRLTSGSIWPGVFAHATVNTMIPGFINVVFAADDPQAVANPWTVGLTGWPGWLVMLAVVAVLVLRSRESTRGPRERVRM